MRDLDLLNSGVCRQDEHDPDTWVDPDQAELAVRLCRTGASGSACPALSLCLDYSTDPREESMTASGVWGGVTERRRSVIRRGRNRDRTVTFPVTIPSPRVSGFYS